MKRPLQAGVSTSSLRGQRIDDAISTSQEQHRHGTAKKKGNLENKRKSSAIDVGQTGNAKRKQKRDTRRGSDGERRKEQNGARHATWVRRGESRKEEESGRERKRK